MILPDYSIQSKDNDKLKRTPLAQKADDLILEFKASESFVVGIEGAWGAVKTSFINVILETLSNKVYHFVFNPFTSKKDLKNKLTGYAKKLSDLLHNFLLDKL